VAATRRRCRGQSQTESPARTGQPCGPRRSMVGGAEISHGPALAIAPQTANNWRSQSTPPRLPKTSWRSRLALDQLPVVRPPLPLAHSQRSRRADHLSEAGTLGVKHPRSWPRAPAAGAGPDRAQLPASNNGGLSRSLVAGRARACPGFIAQFRLQSVTAAAITTPKGARAWPCFPIQVAASIKALAGAGWSPLAASQSVVVERKR